MVPGRSWVNSGSIRVAVSVVKTSIVSGYCVARVQVVLGKKMSFDGTSKVSVPCIARRCITYVLVPVVVLIRVLQW